MTVPSLKKSPEGSATRGTTNPNRLRRVDRWLVHRLQGRLRALPHPLVVDLGYGASGVTPAELLARISAVAPDARVLGLEIDPDRVAAAAPYAGPRLSFAVGGFETPSEAPPLAIRAFNVLRQYDAGRVQAAWDLMRSRLRPGGLLVEGTCDELGRRCSWVSFEKPLSASPGEGERARPDHFTVSLRLDRIDRPSDVAERLPKALIHRNVPGERVHAFLQALDAAWSAAAPHESFGRRQRWLAMCEALRSGGLPLADGRSRWRLGELTVPWELVEPGVVG